MFDETQIIKLPNLFAPRFAENLLRRLAVILYFLSVRISEASWGEVVQICWEDDSFSKGQRSLEHRNALRQRFSY